MRSDTLRYYVDNHYVDILRSSIDNTLRHTQVSDN